jgi:hypothetical protein
MKTEFTSRFCKDLDKLTSKVVKNDVADAIENVEVASKISEINNLYSTSMVFFI